MCHPEPSTPNRQVCESAINVAGMLAKRGLLDDEETEMIYQMIVNEDPEIRRAAAEMIDSVYIKSDLEKAFADEDSKTDKTGFMLKGIVELLHQVSAQFSTRLSGPCDVASLLIDAYVYTYLHA